MPAYSRGKKVNRKLFPGPVKTIKKRKTTLSLQRVIQRTVNRAVNKNIETKESVTKITDGQEIWHNNHIVLNNKLLKTTQGISDPADANTNNRIGDAINLRGVSIKMMVELNERYSDVTFRLMVIKSHRGDAIDRGAIFVGQSDNKMLDKFNTERYTLLAQKWFKLKAPNTATQGGGAVGIGSGINIADSANTVMSRATKIVKVWIPASKFVRSGIVTYDNGGQDPKFFDYSAVLYAYSNYSTLQDDFYVARLNDCVVNMYYKDA